MKTILAAVIFTALLTCISVANLHAGYDPLRVDGAAAEHHDFDVPDEKRLREIPIRVYLPRADAAAPVVLFSHGLGGSRENSRYLANHWADRGYVAVFLQHPGSDNAVWKDTPPRQRMAAMRQAAGAKNLQLRIHDVPAVLDQLERWNDTESHPLAGRLDLRRVGMSGHSFGAITTQAVSGQFIPLGHSVREPRIQAAVMFSPSGPKGRDPKRAFADVKIPWLLMTGTHDEAPIGGQTVESRLSVFPSLPAGDKYELVLAGAEHSAFSDRRLPGDRQRRNPNHHRAILALTTAFWDAYLKGDAEAKAWLNGDAVTGVLEKDDRWQKK